MVENDCTASCEPITLPKCPNCGKRGTFHRLAVKDVPNAHASMTVYECPRCGFRWVSLCRKWPDDAARATLGKERPI